MTAAAPQIFDRVLVRRFAARRAKAAPDALWLFAEAADQIAFRLSAVERDFGRALDLGGFLRFAPQARARAAHWVCADVHAALLRDAPGPKLVCEAEATPFAPRSFDLVIAFMGLHDANDAPGALVQLARVLTPDGLLLAVFPGGDTLSGLRAAFMQAELEIEGGASPRIAPFADVRDWGGLLQRAGLALPVADVEPVHARYREPFRLLRDLQAMGFSNALAARRRGPVGRATLARALQIFAGRADDGTGRAMVRFDLVHLSGWAPHESQQKPLRPGTARARLADALGTRERSAGEKAGPSS